MPSLFRSVATVAAALVLAGCTSLPRERGYAQTQALVQVRRDAAFLSGAHMTLKRRTASASGDLAWVGSESEIHASKDGEPLAIVSTETAVLKKTTAGWKIVHLHWSSRRLAHAH